MPTDPQILRAIGAKALELIPDGSIVGLGTGQAATAFIHALGDKVKAGLRVRGVPTSRDSEKLAQQLGIPLTTLDEVEAIDVDVDGADEVDPRGDLIKGYGGALLREKVVAVASKKLVILVGPEKIVPVLGSRGKVPVEVVPFAVATCKRKIAALGYDSEVRSRDGKPVVTDNGNNILDCRVPPLTHPGEVELALRVIPGVVGTGLFLGMRPTVLIGHGDRVEVR